jgi:hypothetical protein
MVLRIWRDVNCGGEAALKRGAYSCLRTLTGLAGLSALMRVRIWFRGCRPKGRRYVCSVALRSVVSGLFFISHGESKIIVGHLSAVKGGHVGRPGWFGLPVRAK